MKWRIVVLAIFFCGVITPNLFGACYFTKTVYTKKDHETKWRVYERTTTTKVRERAEGYAIMATMGYPKVQLAIHWFENFDCKNDYAYVTVSLETNDPPFNDHKWDRHWNERYYFEYGSEYEFKYKIRDKAFRTKISFAK